MITTWKTNGNTKRKKEGGGLSTNPKETNPLNWNEVFIENLILNLLLLYVVLTDMTIYNYKSMDFSTLNFVTWTPRSWLQKPPEDLIFAANLEMVFLCYGSLKIVKCISLFAFQLISWIDGGQGLIFSLTKICG